MPPREMDPGFPACCRSCPHREHLTAACEHDLRQSLVWELEDGRSCPVYADEKSDAMRALAADL